MRIPIPFKDLLPVDAVKQLTQLVAQPALVSAIKDAAQKMGIKDVGIPANIHQVLQQAGRWMESVSDPWLRDVPAGLKPGINATGELFSNRWCAHRLSDSVLAQSCHLQSRYAETTKLDQQLRNLLVGLTSAQAVLVAPNLTSALYLVALADATSPQPSRWVLPRIDCIRLPQAGASSGGNVRSILDATHARVVEIGTTQDCEINDFSEALQADGSRLLQASPNSLSSESFEEHRRRGIAQARQANRPITQILIDGSLHDLRDLGIASSPIANCWDEGVDLAIVPGDGLLGGPECGLILGKQLVMENILKLADAIGLHATSTAKAALLHTLQTSESLEQWKQTPVGAALTISSENLQHRAERLAVQLAGSPQVERAAAIQKSCRVGAGAWSSRRVDSSVVQLYPKSISPSALAESLANCSVPIWCNVHSDHVELVLRSIEPDEDRWIVQQVFPAQA